MKICVAHRGHNENKISTFCVHLLIWKKQTTNFKFIGSGLSESLIITNVSVIQTNYEIVQEFAFFPSFLCCCHLHCNNVCPFLDISFIFARKKSVSTQWLNVFLAKSLRCDEFHWNHCFCCFWPILWWTHLTNISTLQMMMQIFCPVVGAKY